MDKVKFLESVARKGTAQRIPKKAWTIYLGQFILRDKKKENNNKKASR